MASRVRARARRVPGGVARAGRAAAGRASRAPLRRGSDRRGAGRAGGRRRWCGRRRSGRRSGPPPRCCSSSNTCGTSWCCAATRAVDAYGVSTALCSAHPEIVDASPPDPGVKRPASRVEQGERGRVVGQALAGEGCSDPVGGRRQPVSRSWTDSPPNPGPQIRGRSIMSSHGGRASSAPHKIVDASPPTAESTGGSSVRTSHGKAGVTQPASDLGRLATRIRMPIFQESDPGSEASKIVRQPGPRAQPHQPVRSGQRQGSSAGGRLRPGSCRAARTSSPTLREAGTRFDRVDPLTGNLRPGRPPAGGMPPAVRECEGDDDRHAAADPVRPRRRLRLQDPARRAGGGGRRADRRRRLRTGPASCSSAWTTATTPPWSGSRPARRSWPPPTSSPRWSTTRTTGGGSPPPTRCPTCTRWAAPRSSRSTCSAGRATCCRWSWPPRCCAAASTSPARPAATSPAGTASTTRSRSTAWRSPASPTRSG